MAHRYNRNSSISSSCYNQHSHTNSCFGAYYRIHSQSYFCTNNACCGDCNVSGDWRE